MAGYNHTIDDADPVFKYYPYSDGDDSGGWAPYFAGSGGFRNIKNEPGDDGTGQSLHYTAFSGSSVALEFHGTAVYLYGSANCTYDVTIDGSVIGSGLTSTTDTLFATGGLSSGIHSLNLTVHASDENQFALDNATITDSLPTGVDSLVPVVFDNTNSTLIYSGAWDVHSDYQIPSKAAPKPYHQTSASMASVSLNFNGSAVAINGALNWGHWTYNVILDGVSRQYNASTFWLVGNTQLFWQSGLDPNQPHQIELINSAAAGMVMSLNDFTVYGADPTSSSSGASSSSSNLPSSISSTQSSEPVATGSTATSNSSSKVNVGAIVGPVVAGVVLIVLIIAALVWNRRRKVPNTPVLVEEPLVMPTLYHHEGYSQTNLNEKTGQTVMSFTALPLSAQPYQSEGAPFSPYGAHPTGSGTQSMTQLSHSIPPSTTQHAQSQPPPVPAQQPVDVDRIIELIAQRIDRAPSSGGDAPPQYPL